jgi:hypothetical protein
MDGVMKLPEILHKSIIKKQEGVVLKKYFENLMKK